MMIIPPVQSLATILGGEQRSATKLLTTCFVGAALVSVVDFTFQAGIVSVTDSFSQWIADAGYDAEDSKVPALTPLQPLELT